MVIIYFGNGDSPHRCLKMRSGAALAPVAQLDRVFGYEPKGQGFESLLAYQKKLAPKGAFSCHFIGFCNLFGGLGVYADHL